MKINEIYYKKINEKLYVGEHESGLKVYVFPKKDFSKKHAYFMTEYGSVFNSFIGANGEVIDKPIGIAHFLEHKIFEESEGNIFEKFALLGANVNAYTKFESTTYNFSTVDNFYEALKLLIEFVQKPYITEENVEKEKGIIEQEIKMYLDDADWKVYFNALKAIYENNEVREDIAGSVESIKEITKDDLMECYNYFYSPANMIIFVVGDVDKDEVFNTVNSSLSEEFIGRKTVPKVIFKEENKNVNLKEIHEYMDVSQAKFIFGFKDTRKYSVEELYRRSFAIKIAIVSAFGVSSSFYNNAYENGLIDESFSSEHSFSKYYLHTIFGGESDYPIELYEKVLEEIKRIKKEGFDLKSLTRIKRKFTGRYIASFNSLQSIASLFTDYYIKGINSFEYLDVLENISFDYIKEVFDDHFDTDNSVISIIESEGK
ncbi:pitrilysin family protein [Clostridiaceae bacterium HSG29]|nr:pitrilysin family protein [Clostridiaceae bacterium HSG29]